MPETDQAATSAVEPSADAVDELLEADPYELYEHAPCGYLSTLPDGTIVKVNETFLQWTGLRRETLVGHRRFAQLLTPGGQIYHETHYAPLLRMQGFVREIAVDIVRSDGSRLPALINATLKTAPDGEPLLVRTMVFDATERREYERELLRARQRAEESEARARLLAQTLQQSLIPPAPPSVPGMDVGAVYRPAFTGDEVGGDFYDLFELPGGDWALVIGDVCGKGAEAAAVTALARYTVRAAAIREPAPEAVLTTLNDALLRQDSSRFCTVIYARLAVTTEGRIDVRFASGGHPLPILVSGTLPPQPTGRPGDLLGIMPDAVAHPSSLTLETGDALLLYTDGITEGRRGSELFGDDRLAAALNGRRDHPAQAMAQGLVDEVVTYQGGLPRDDIAVVVLRPTPSA